MTLHVQNRAQPFLRVTLPPGASIVSVEIAGQTAKPVLGADGTRVPLLRARDSAARPYQVSFVYLHAGAPFARKGEIEMTLPRMDIPVGVVEWEVFVPDNYSVRHVDGNAISQRVVQRALVREAEQARKDEMARVQTGSVDALQRSGGGPGCWIRDLLRGTGVGRRRRRESAESSSRRPLAIGRAGLSRPRGGSERRGPAGRDRVCRGRATARDPL